MNKKNEIRLESSVIRVKEVISSEVDGETMLMSLENSRYYGMDEIGSRIWNLLDEPRTVRDLCGLLTQEFDVEQGGCEQDVLTFLNQLKEDNLIIVHNE